MMSPASVFIVLFALVCANVPFLNQRLFACIPLPQLCRQGRKRTCWRLIELMLLYCGVGVCARLLEARAGNVFTQDWPFYVITVSLFLVFAAPGVTFCYLNCVKIKNTAKIN
jgi:hypothetical protein